MEREEVEGSGVEREPDERQQPSDEAWRVRTVTGTVGQMERGDGRMTRLAAMDRDAEDDAEFRAGSVNHNTTDRCKTRIENERRLNELHLLRCRTWRN